MVWSWLRRSTWLLLWSAIVLCGGVLDTLASGLSIAPIRLVFDGRSRVATVYLTNKGDAESTYRILVRDKRMLESGQIVDAVDAWPGERFASELMRYSPRRVVLKPGSSQTVRVMLRNPSEGRLEHGEYRTHLVFQSVPNVPAPGEQEQDGHTVAHAIQNINAIPNAHANGNININADNNAIVVTIAVAVSVPVAISVS